MVQGLKRVFGRESPQAASSPTGIWRPFSSMKHYQSNQPKYYAFPSGHITTITSIVTVLNENYPNSVFAQQIGYAAIGLVAVSLYVRMWHWFSDFPPGVALGYGFGKLAASHSNSEPAPETTEYRHATNIEFFPEESLRSIGMACHLTL